MFSTPGVAATLAGNRANLAWIQDDLDKRAAKQLMDYVLKPTQENVKKAKAMIVSNPKIMFIKTEGIEWASGVEEYVDVVGETHRRAVPRIVKSSPLKAALGTGDKELYDYMTQHSDNVVYKNENGDIIETGIQRAQRQIKEQFPSGFEYPPVEKEFTDLMAEIFHAIRNDQTLLQTNQPAPATQALLNKFRHYFLPKEVTEGHHFNLNYLIEVLKLYESNRNPWNARQRSLFLCQVIGYLERLVPIVDVQAFCQGLYYRVIENRPPTRSLTVYNHITSTDSDYFSSTPNSTSFGLGFDFGIYIYSGGASSWGMVRDASWCVLKNYVKQKHQSLTTFNNTLNNGLISKPWCAIL